MSKKFLNSSGLSKFNQQVVLSAWARSLGLEEATLHTANDAVNKHQRIEIAAERGLDDWDPRSATFLQLFNVTILYGPQWFLDAAKDVPDEVLALESTMFDLGYRAQAHSHGEEAIYYAEDIPFYDDAHLSVTSNRREARRLARACPPDDTATMPIEALEYYFTISTFAEDAEPLAGAGYDVFSGTVGQLAVLVAAAQRTKGYGTFMLARVAEECMFDGLLPQWVTPVADEVGAKMAADVGFLLSGFRTSVTFA